MSTHRLIFVLIAFVGFAFSTWSARPASGADVMGWLFACVWTSLAWVALCVGTLRSKRAAEALGGVIAVAATEPLFFYATEPLLLVVKPLVQFAALGLGALLVAIARRLKAVDV